MTWRNSMDIGVLYNLPEETLNSRGSDQLADLDVIETATSVQAALEANGHKASSINFYESGVLKFKILRCDFQPDRESCR